MKRPHEITETVEPLPHVAIIMDGNGRWAKSRGLSRPEGHLAGVEAIKRIVKAALYRNLPVLTLFAFSSENRLRPEAEVNFLFNLMHRYFDEHLKDLAEEGVYIKIIGEIDGLPQATLKLIEHAQNATRENNKMTLQIAFNYGSQEEIVYAAKSIATKVCENKLFPADITKEVFEEHLRTASLPSPDLIIRTSGEYRLSNFMLWQAAYAELYFTDVYWPDFNERELDIALKEYSTRERRFGRIIDDDNSEDKKDKSFHVKFSLEKASK
ncbi:MAG: isoprenyl transferase [Pseudomonadota bacterium]|nr:isoprenyl transferase [Pseudomonadota bacterium]